MRRGVVIGLATVLVVGGTTWLTLRSDRPGGEASRARTTVPDLTVPMDLVDVVDPRAYLVGELERRLEPAGLRLRVARDDVDWSEWSVSPSSGTPVRVGSAVTLDLLGQRDDATPAPGHRIVGRGGAAIEVPEDWTTGAERCGTAMEDTVLAYATVTRACLVRLADPVSSVSVSPRGRPEQAEDRAWEDDHWVRVVDVDDTRFVVRTTTRREGDAIAGGAALLPDEWIGVPDVLETRTGRLPSRRIVERRLESAGLGARFERGDRSSTSPRWGTVVPRGSVVTVVVGR